MAGKIKDLLEDIATKVEANRGSAFCVGDSLTIADIMVSHSLCRHLLWGRGAFGLNTINVRQIRPGSGGT